MKVKCICEIIITTGVQKYSTVSVRIAAETSNGTGPFSDEVSALTYEDCESCVCLYITFNFI